MLYDQAALQKVREDRLLIDAVDRWLYEEIAPFLGRRVLEVGCGLGNFARHLADRELYVGTEVEPSAVDAVRPLFADAPAMRFDVADATSPAFRDYGRLGLDTVFSLNVFEHIQDDQAAFDNAYHVLQPGGRLVLIVPAHAWLYGEIDRAIGHYRRYDRRLMAQRMAASGFELERTRYLNAAGALGWFVSARLRRQDTPPAGQLKLFNRVVPILKAVERAVPPPFGISILGVGRKPSSSPPAPALAQERAP